MTRDMERFIAERAENLAVVCLTRRDDLLVSRTSTSDSGLGLLVTVRRDGVPTGRVFGVETKARMEALREPGAARVRPTAAESRRFQDIAFPVCVFLFTMGDDQGYYRWLQEPVIGPNRQPALRMTDNGWTALDNGALARIVEAVDAWYDARRHLAA